MIVMTIDQLRELIAEVAAMQWVPPCFCEYNGWTEDEGWEPNFPEERRGSLDYRGNWVGYLPCYICNEDGDGAPPR